MVTTCVFVYCVAHKDFGHFYGSSYVAGPNGSRTPVSHHTCIVSICMYVLHVRTYVLYVRTYVRMYICAYICVYVNR